MEAPSNPGRFITRLPHNHTHISHTHTNRRQTNTLDEGLGGGLLLQDACLTIADITEGRFHGDVAGLSACKTAVGGVDLLDEAITLAAALHYTGYRNVVAKCYCAR